MRARGFVMCTNLPASNTHHLLHHTEASTTQGVKILVPIFGLHTEVDAAGSGKRQYRSAIPAASFERARFVLYVSSSNSADPGKQTLVPKISNRDKTDCFSRKVFGATFSARASKAWGQAKLPNSIRSLSGEDPTPI
jgi:hypothetical protein